MLRGLLNVLGYVPIPSNAMVTPVTFRVRKRKLRGFLADCSTAEDGKRELAGEWVVGRHLWRRLQAEWRASRGEIRKSSVASLKGHSVDHKDRVILYIHGGMCAIFPSSGVFLKTPRRVFHVQRRHAQDNDNSIVKAFKCTTFRYVSIFMSSRDVLRTTYCSY